MIAFKGFHEDLTCTKGAGIFQYVPGVKITEENSKCARTGLHCAEYILDCLKWYPLNGNNRYFRVDANGSLDEDGIDSKISCTEMTLIQELDVKGIALEAMCYMVSHPHRDWMVTTLNCQVSRDSAEGSGEGSIAIARGKTPVVKGEIGTVAGLLIENENGDEIIAAKLFMIDGKKIKPGKWYGFTSRELKEVKPS